MNTDIPRNRPSVLLIEDDRCVAEALGRVLEAQQYRVVATANAYHALEQFRTEPVDLLVLDIDLVANDGWQVFFSLRQIKPSVATIIVTAEWRQVQRGIAAGVDAFFEKPIDLNVFEQVVRDLVIEGSKRRQTSLGHPGRFCRQALSHNELWLRQLEARHWVPLELSPSLELRLRNSSKTEQPPDRSPGTPGPAEAVGPELVEAAR